MKGPLSIAVLTLAACASQPKRDFTICPARGGPAWSELESEHFVLDTNGDVADARTLLAELERAHFVFTQVAFAMTRQPRDRLRVVMFRDEVEFRQFGARWSVGHFVESGFDHEPAPTIALFGALTEETRMSLLHELAHRFTAFHYPRAPVWLSEGLALYFESLYAGDGAVYLGNALPGIGLNYVDTDIICRSDIAEHGGRCFIPAGRIPRLDVLHAVARDDFYGRERTGETAPDRARARATHYAAAWAWVHFLRNGPEPYAARFDAYLAALASGAADPWATTLGALDVEQMEDALHAHHRSRPPILKTPLVLPAVPAPRERALDSAEVHILWARLGSDEEAYGSTRIENEIEEAQREAPGAPEVIYMRGWHAYRKGDASRARADLTRAVELAPEEPRYLLALAVVLERLGDTTALDEVVLQLRKHARSARALELLGDYHARRGEPDIGLPFARRALEANPSCWSCWDTMAGLLQQKGILGQAVDAQRAAVGLAPDSAVPAATERLMRLEAELAAKATSGVE